MTQSAKSVFVFGLYIALLGVLLIFFPNERVGVTSGHVARRIWELLLRPRRVIYVPRWLGIVPWVELSFGWLEDLLGPLLLRMKQPPAV